MRLKVLKTPQYQAWFDEQDSPTQLLIEARIMRLEQGHYGVVNRFEGLTELKWKSGLRIYTAVKPPRVIILLGGNKRGQDKDIRKAKTILSQFD